MNRKLAVIYHFFPHYRKGILEEIHAAFPETVFVADSAPGGPGGSINAYIPPVGFREIKLRRICFRFYYLSGLWSIIREEQPKHLIFLGDTNCLSVWFWAIAGRIAGKKIFFWAHGWIDENESFFQRHIRQIFFRIPQRILVYGRRSRYIAVGRGFDAGKVHVIYNSLDYHSQKLIRSDLDSKKCRKDLLSLFPSGENVDRVIVCSSRLTKVKRFDLVIEAVALISSSKIGIVFIGDGPEREALANLATENKVSVHFVGACYDENKLASYFIGAEAVVSPGNVGLTAMHAMAYGALVVTHGNRNAQMPEMEAIIPGLTGEIFEEGSAQSLAESIERMASASAERKEFSRKACIAMIERFFTAENQLTKIDEALNDIDETERLDTVISEHEIITS